MAVRPFLEALDWSWSVGFSTDETAVANDGSPFRRRILELLAGLCLSLAQWDSR
jgi:hypothetical protein